MRITVVGGIVIIAAVIAALVILRLSQAEHSVALPRKVNPNERPDTGRSGSQTSPGEMP